MLRRMSLFSTGSRMSRYGLKRSEPFGRMSSEDVRGLRVVSQQPFRLGERVIRDLRYVGGLGHGSTYLRIARCGRRAIGSSSATGTGCQPSTTSGARKGGDGPSISTTGSSVVGWVTSQTRRHG